MSEIPYEAMPDERKRQICIELMDEFGIDYVETQKGELRHQCTLPFGGHTDRNSVTASVNYRKLVFHCWVCQGSGSLVWWIAVNRKETLTQSQEWIRDAAGFTSGIPINDLLSIINTLFHPKVEERVITNYPVKMLDPWLGWGMHHPYLTLPWTQGGREIPDETLERFKVGYCDADDDWQYYQRVVIPFFWGDKLVGWQARRLDPGDPNPAKYLSSPDLPRDRILFAAPETLQRTDWAVLVESPMSVLRHAHHLPVVASLGTDLTDLQCKLLHRYRRLVLCLDNDKGGWDALRGHYNRHGKLSTPGLIARLRPYVELWVVDSPYGSIEGRSGAPDPSDLTEDEFATLVDEAPPSVLWRVPNQAKLGVYRREDEAMAIRKYGTGEVIHDDQQQAPPPPPAPEPESDTEEPTGDDR